MTNPPEYPDAELREFDDLARQEAAERGELYVSPFDAAAAAAAPAGNDTAGDEQLQFGEIPKSRRDRKKKAGSGRTRGRPKKSAAAPSAAAPKSARPSHSAPVQGPPAPAPAAAPPSEPIPSAQLVPLVKRLDGAIAARVGTDRLTTDEATEGAAALAHLLHYYLPVALNKPWGPFAAWAVLAYGPRMLERAASPGLTQVELNRIMREQREEAQPASTASTFPPAATSAPADANPPYESDYRPPLAKKDPFFNELDNQPAARSVPRP